MAQYSLIILNPGHFHAALTLRECNALIEDDVHVFAEDGPDLEDFLQRVHGFNDRAQQPTRWTLYVHRGADFLEKLVATQAPGAIVVVAGRNDVKMAQIHHLHARGFHVLGDKPWLTGAGGLGLLREAVAGPPLAMDIITERHEVANRLLRVLVRNAAVFGEFRREGGAPAVALRSVHHLGKTVGGRPLRRPAWYFDTGVQGEGIVDVTTHLVDLAQWFLEDGMPFACNRDVEGLSARQWPIDVPLEAFTRITGEADFPERLRGNVSGGMLRYLCNAALSFRLRGVPVEIESSWALEQPPGGGDLYHAVLRGTLAELEVAQEPQSGFRTELAIRPAQDGRAFESALAAAVAELQRDFPGLGLERTDDGFRARIPPPLRSTHEQHFAAVLDGFLRCVDAGGWPARIGADLDFRYSLLARAREVSRAAR
ncbi:MAG TPA: putative oxidoreductase C-terminal domain-containing protein [Burkholderiales bacterium]|nr:putative oxidoreductase C-terminal domain-containing protein [Burkholderiales bacterium]